MSMVGPSGRELVAVRAVHFGHGLSLYLYGLRCLGRHQTPFHGTWTQINHISTSTRAWAHNTGEYTSDRLGDAVTGGSLTSPSS